MYSDRNKSVVVWYRGEEMDSRRTQDNFLGGEIFLCVVITAMYAIVMEKAVAPTPVLLPGKSHGGRRLLGCRLWGCTESDTTEAT